MHPLRWMVLSLVAVLSGTYASAQTLTCNRLVQISVDQQCQKLLSADDILEDPGVGPYELTLKAGNRILERGPEPLLIDGRDANGQPYFYINRTLRVEVRDLTNNNLCWGDAAFEDKLGPVITGAAVVDLSCTDSLLCVALPVATDNCSASFLNLVDEVFVQNDICLAGGSQIVRTYVAQDFDGNLSAPFIVTINVAQSGIEFPRDIEWTCEQYAAYPSITDARLISNCVLDTRDDNTDGLLNNDTDDDEDPSTVFSQDNDPITVGLVVGADDDDGFCAPFGERDSAAGSTCDTAVCNLTITAGGTGITCALPRVNGLEDDDVLERTGSGVPNVFGAAGFCMYNTTFQDDTLATCGGSLGVFKILRVWRVLNMCTNAITTDTQVISVADRIAPVFTLVPTLNLPANENPNGYPGICGASGLLPAPVITDNCSGISAATVRVNTPAGRATAVVQGGVIVGYRIPSPFLPLGGPYTVTYTVSDNCGNSATATQIVNVVDVTPPVAICDEITNLSLTGTSATAILARSLDDGSYDQCNDVFFKVLRMDEEQAEGLPGRGLSLTCNAANSEELGESGNFSFFDDEAFFCCDDDATEMLIVRVFDVDPGRGAVDPGRMIPGGDLFNRFNDCMVEVRIEDKVAPVLLVGAPNRTLSCTQLGLVQQYANVANLTFDAPTFQDNCAFTVSLTVNDGTGNCGAGVITRTFRATDNQGNQSVTVTQRITVLLEHDYTILFPDDLDIRDCLFGVGTNDTLTEDRLIERDCDLLAVSHTDRLFTADDDACYKILRTYDVINWCEWNGVDAAINITNPSFTTAGPRLDVTVSTAGVDVVRINGQLQPFGSVGRFSYVQIIKVYDTIDPTLTNISQAACTPASVVAIDPTTCGQAVAVSFDLNDNCADEFNVSYRLVAFAGPGTNPVTGLPVRAVTLADLATAAQAGTSFPNDPFGGTIVGRTRNAQGVFVNVPAGTVTIQGSFPLGNHILVITVNDQCGNLIEAYVPFTARDCKAPTVKVLNGLAINNMQTGTITVTARMFDAGSSDACSAVKLSYSPNVNDTARTFTCADLGTTTVRIYGTDAAGNQDFVETYIIIQDQTGVCSGTSPRIAARLTTDGGNGVAGATVKVSGDAQMTATSDVNGAADFTVVAGGDYSVTAENRANAANGVSTFDIAMVGRHVLGTSPLTTFSELTAADASGNGTISAYDMTVIRRVVLGLDAEFRGSPSWRFFNAGDYSLEVFNVNDAAGVTPAEFLAVKIGDVSGNARANARQALAPRTLTGEFALVAADARLGAGEAHTVVFGASDLNVAGYQLTLEWDPTAVSVEGVEALTHDAEGFGTHLLADGKLTLSYAGEMSEELFGLKVRALRAGVVLSEAFQVTSAVTTAEAYGADANLQSVTLRFGGATAATGYALEQNRPNPFANTTLIGFTMGETADATLVVTDIAGRVVWRVNGNYEAGHNVVEIAGDELPKGVLNYTLTAGDYTATRKMIKID